MTFPALSYLKKLYPSAEISYLGGMEAQKKLILSTGNVERVYIHNVKENTMADLLLLALRLRRQHFDLAISFGASPRGLDILFLKLAGCREILGMENKRSVYRHYRQIPLPDSIHRVDKNLKLVEALGKDKDTELVTIQVKKELTKALFERFHIPEEKPCIGLVVGAGNFMYRQKRKIIQYNTKKWGLDKFVRLAKMLEKDGYTVVLLGGKTEHTDIETAECSFSPSSIDLTGKTDLMETIGVMKGCESIIGGDSGPMHCAAAAGIPTLTLFGPTDASLIAPYGEKSECLISEYPCTRCYSLCNEKGRSCMPAKCMEAIRVEDVYNRIKERMKKEQ
jgi:ADP-heptose:LPS heptosyltransferase